MSERFLEHKSTPESKRLKALTAILGGLFGVVEPVMAQDTTEHEPAISHKAEFGHDASFNNEQVSFEQLGYYHNRWEYILEEENFSETMQSRINYVAEELSSKPGTIYVDIYVSAPANVDHQTIANLIQQQFSQYPNELGSVTVYPVGEITDCLEVQVVAKNMSEGELAAYRAGLAFADQAAERVERAKSDAVFVQALAGIGIDSTQGIADREMNPEAHNYGSAALTLDLHVTAPSKVNNLLEGGLGAQFVLNTLSGHPSDWHPTGRLFGDIGYAEKFPKLTVGTDIRVSMNVLSATAELPTGPASTRLGPTMHFDTERFKVDIGGDVGMGISDQASWSAHINVLVPLGDGFLIKRDSASVTPTPPTIDSYPYESGRTIIDFKKVLAIPDSIITAADLPMDQALWRIRIHDINQLHINLTGFTDPDGIRDHHGWPLISIAEHDFEQLFFNDGFQKLLAERVGTMTVMNGLSLAEAIERRLKQDHQPVSPDTVYRTGQELLETLDGVRNRELIGGSTNLIVLRHAEDRFQTRQVFDYYSSSQPNQTGKVLGEFVGAKDHNAALDTIRTQTGPTTILFEGHGGPDGLYLRGGKNISYEELGDALIASGDVSHLNIILNACYGYDYKENLMKYLTDKGMDITGLVVISSGNDDRLSYAVLMNAMYEEAGATGMSTVTVEHFLKAEGNEFVWRYTDASLSVGQSTRALELSKVIPVAQHDETVPV